jgi:hypothetical protein
LRPDAPFVFYNETGYAPANASAPVLSLYFNDKVNTYATLIFGCIQQARVRPDQCRMQRLSRYGVRSAAQQRSFRKIERTDARVAALWMLVRKREPNAAFRARECTGEETTDCVSWAAFKKRRIRRFQRTNVTRCRASRRPLRAFATTK